MCDATCVVCRETLSTKQSGVCLECSQHFVSAPLPAELLKRVANEESGPLHTVCALYGLYPQAPFFEVLHAIKYHHTMDLAAEMGRRLGQFVRYSSRPVDGIIPIPLHPARRRERGYNQSECIANGIAEVLNAPVYCNVIRRARNNTTQTDLKHSDRKANVSGIFTLRSDASVPCGHMLVVDDVMTTGATILEAIRTMNCVSKDTIFSIGVLATTGKQ